MTTLPAALLIATEFLDSLYRSYGLKDCIVHSIVDDGGIFGTGEWDVIVRMTLRDGSKQAKRVRVRKRDGKVLGMGDESWMFAVRPFIPPISNGTDGG